MNPSKVILLGSILSGMNMEAPIIKKSEFEGIDIVKEYKLIKEKKSNLSARKREKILRMIEGQ